MRLFNDLLSVFLPIVKKKILAPRVGEFAKAKDAYCYFYARPIGANDIETEIDVLGAVNYDFDLSFLVLGVADGWTHIFHPKHGPCWVKSTMFEE